VSTNIRIWRNRPAIWDEDFLKRQALDQLETLDYQVILQPSKPSPAA
jgi:hypothetical protein